MNNYRPISFLQISYKIFAAIILQRLKDAGAEQRIWTTQVGFKTAYGTADALFMIRRIIDRTLASKDDALIILALDWAKAFDAISPDALCLALSRFGISARMTKVIKEIYRNRVFNVKRDSQASSFHAQHFGISQGCPLSPFLFSILMTILMHDARAHYAEFPHDLSELLYADDTLFVGRNPDRIQQYMEKIASVGAKYGLS